MNRFPGITKLANGKYKVVVSEGSGTSRKRRSKTFKTLQEAREFKFVHEENKVLSKGRYCADVTIPVAFELFVNTKRKSIKTPGTLRTYEFSLLVISRDLNNLKLKDVNVQAMQRFLDKLSHQYVKSTLNKIKTHLSLLFDVLVVERVMQVNPLSVVVIHSRKAGKKHVDKVLELEQYQQLLRYYNEKSVNELTVYDLITWVTLSTGMRTGEALDLKWDDFEVEGVVRVDGSYDDIAKISKSTKTERSNRMVPIPKQLVEKIKQWYHVHISREHTLSEHVFLTEIGNVPTSRALNHRFKNTQQMVLGVQSTETVSNHATRHSFISVMLSPSSSNMDVAVVANMVGDTVETVQRIYQHTLDIDKRIAVSAVHETINGLIQ